MIDRTWTRRDLLAAVPAATAAAILAPDFLLGAMADPIPPAKFRFGLVTYLWGLDLSLPELIEVCEASQFLGVELRTTHAHKVERNLDEKARAEVKARFADSPVTLVGIGSDERFDSPDGAKLVRAKAATREFLRLSKDIGGSGVKVKPNSFHPGVKHETTIAQIGESLLELAPFAEELGQEIRLEVHGGCSPLPIIEQIVAIADHPAVKVCWNSNEEDLRGEGIDKNFERVKGRLGGTLHVRRLDEKRYPYPRLFELLRQEKWAGWMLLEAHGQAPKERVAAMRQQGVLFKALAGLAAS